MIKCQLLIPTRGEIWACMKMMSVFSTLRHVTVVCAVCSDRVQSLCYLQLTRQLVSCSSDGGIAVWNMDVSREEVREGKAGLTRRAPTACLLVFYPVTGDASQGAGSPSSYWLAADRVLHVTLHCIHYSLESFHRDKRYTQPGHLGWFSQTRARRGPGRRSGMRRGVTVGKRSEVAHLPWGPRDAHQGHSSSGKIYLCPLLLFSTDFCSTESMST